MCDALRRGSTVAWGGARKKATLSLEGVPNARLATLTSPLLISGCFWQWMRVCCHGQSAEEEAPPPSPPTASPSPVSLPSPPSFSQYPHHRSPAATLTLSSLVTPNVDAPIRPLCELCGACSELELFLLSNRSEKACTRLKFSCGAPPHAPGSV